MRDEIAEDFAFWEGFDACLEMVLKTVQSSDLISDGDIVLSLCEEIIEDATLYKTDG